MAATLDGCDRAMPRLTLNDAVLDVAVQALHEGGNGADAAQGSSRHDTGQDQLRASPPRNG
jgi:hypothetical protein